MKLLKRLTLLFISTTIFSAPLFAEDALLKSEAIPPSITHNWTGFYGGINIGAVNHTLNMTDNQATTFYGTIQQVSNPQFTGGFQVGYRRQLALMQMTGIYGVELSANFANASFNKNYGSSFSLYELSSENSLKTLCLLEFLGGVAVDKMLVFLAAGFSWANIQGTTTNVVSVPFFNSFSVNQQAFGTALGAGIEYALNEKFSARFKIDVATPNSYSTSDNIGDTFQISNSIVQGTFAINYKFA